MKKDKIMSLDEHIATANDLAIATHHLGEVFFRCQEHYNKTSRLMQLLSKVRSRILSGVQSELDNEYHKLISDEEFKEYGHIYYNLEERYENIKKSK